MLFELLLCAFTILSAAQTSTSTTSSTPTGTTSSPSASTSQSASPASSISTTSPFPTHSVFFPGDLPSGATNLAASVITANINQTAYAIGCPPHPTNATTPSSGKCKLPTSLTVTGGTSTLIYTYHPDSDGQPTLSPTTNPVPSGLSIDNAGGATLTCALFGGTSASQAICTGSSSISGLGLVGSTTTLASSQIEYASFTVTAGFEALASASAVAASSSGGSGGAGVRGTSGARASLPGLMAVWTMVSIGVGIGLGIVVVM